MASPTITIQMGASANTVTITEGDKETVFDRSKMSLDDRIKLTKLLVPAWAKAHGIEFKPYRGRKKGRGGRAKAS